MAPRPRVEPTTSASTPRIGSYELSGHIVVWAEGEVEGSTAPRLRDELVAAIDRRSARLVVDLSAATFADSTGLDVLVGALRANDIIGGEVRIVGAGQRLQELLAYAGLDPLYVDGSVEEAVADGAGSTSSRAALDGAAATSASSAGRSDDPGVNQSASDEVLSGSGRAQEDGAGAAGAATETLALRAEIDRLRQTMQRRAVIEQAKGVLMLRYGVEEERAFSLLRQWSQKSNTPLHTVAETLVHAICRGVRSPAYSTQLVRWLELKLRQGPDTEAAPAGAADAEAGR